MKPKKQNKYFSEKNLQYFLFSTGSISIVIVIFLFYISLILKKDWLLLVTILGFYAVFALIFGTSLDRGKKDD